MANKNIPWYQRHKIQCVVLCLLAIFSINIMRDSKAYAQKQIFTPQIPKANRHQKNKVFLEYADKLSMNDKVSTDYQVLTGNVKFRKEGMFMYCDSAYFYDKTNSLDAFGHVKMVQGDTLFVYADVMYYNGEEEMARLRHNVKMINREVTLTTDSLDYDLAANLGYYFEGGKIVDSKNTLTSVYGQYSPNTKNAEFLYDVELLNKKYVMKTDTLNYNTNSHIADIVGRTTIVSDSNIIYSNKGWYNTSNETSTLYNRSLIVGKDGLKLTGDTVFYDRNRQFGEAFGNMILTDSIKKSILQGNYGYHNEKEKKSFATKRARALEYSQGDTLYLHGDTIRTFMDADSFRVMNAYHRVRFYRYDVQGIADSMSFVSKDSILNMYHHPIIWNETKQVFGNEINIHLNDSTVDWATLPNFGFMTEQIQGDYFNQLSGKEMKAYFTDGELRQLDVSGNVQAIMFPSEKDSTYNKLISTESSFLKILFEKQKIEKLTMWPDVTGKAIPLYLAKKSDFYLAGFDWYADLRPQDPDDIFNIPEGMTALFREPEKTVLRHKKTSSSPPPPSPDATEEHKEGAEKRNEKEKGKENKNESLPAEKKDNSQIENKNHSNLNK